MRWINLLALFFIPLPAFQPRRRFSRPQWQRLTCPFCNAPVDPPKTSERRVVYVSDCKCGAQLFVDTACRNIQMMWSFEKTPVGFRVIHNYCPERRKIAANVPPYHDIIHGWCHVTFIQPSIGGVSG